MLITVISNYKYKIKIFINKYVLFIGAAHKIIEIDCKNGLNQSMPLSTFASRKYLLIGCIMGLLEKYRMVLVVYLLEPLNTTHILKYSSYSSKKLLCDE